MVATSIELSSIKLLAAKLSGIKTASLLSFISGAAVTLGFTSLGDQVLRNTFTNCACIMLMRAKWML